MRWRCSTSSTTRRCWRGCASWGAAAARGVSRAARGGRRRGRGLMLAFDLAGRRAARARGARASSRSAWCSTPPARPRSACCRRWSLGEAEIDDALERLGRVAGRRSTAAEQNAEPGLARASRSGVQARSRSPAGGAGGGRPPTARPFRSSGAMGPWAVSGRSVRRRGLHRLLRLVPAPQAQRDSPTAPASSNSRRPVAATVGVGAAPVVP